MTSLRSLARDNFRLAMIAVLVALALKAVLPAGYMLDGATRVLSVHLCGDARGADRLVKITVPAPGEGHSSDGARAASACPYAVLAMAALARADAPALPPLVLAHGLAPALVVLSAAPLRAAWRIRPPLRGPPPLVDLRPE